jgi:hypothetical protein
MSEPRVARVRPIRFDVAEEAQFRAMVQTVVDPWARTNEAGC